MLQAKLREIMRGLGRLLCSAGDSVDVSTRLDQNYNHLLSLYTSTTVLVPLVRPQQGDRGNLATFSQQ